MQLVVAQHCAIGGCHDGTESPKYAGIAEASMKADSSAYSQVVSGRMPRSGALSAAELATFKAFYGH
jgi:hypothetical protein